MASAEIDEKSSNDANIPPIGDFSGGKTNTVRGLSMESDFNNYDVGFAVNAMHAQLMRKESPELMKKFVELKINIYFWSTVAWVCRGDGKLGEKEEKYIKERATLWKVSDDDLVNVLKGKDCTDLLLKAEATLFEQLNGSDKHKQSSNGDEKEKDYENVAKCQLIMQSLVASAQDGIARAEIDVAYKLAEKLDITKERVKQMIQVIRCEQTIANTMNQFFYPEKK